MRASVVAGGDAPPVFEASKHKLYHITEFLEVFVVIDGFLAVGSPGDAGRDVEIGQRIAEAVAVYSLCRQSRQSPLASSGEGWRRRDNR